jgi:amino acid adenylation domain-containing protein
MPNVATLLWAAADADPAAPAVVDPAGTHGYGALRARAAAVAAALRSGGVRPGDRVAILLERGADAAAACFGAAAAGAVAVVVNDTLRARQVEYLLEHCGASTLLTSAALLARQGRTPCTPARIVDVADLPARGAADPVERPADEAAQIIYTSGSTGMPKGVVHSHAGLVAGARTISGYLGLRATDRTASILPFSSVYGFNQLLCAVATGGTLVVERSPLASAVAAALRREGVTVLAAVPPLWHQLLRAPEFAERPLPALRIAQNAGGHLPAEAVRRLRAAQPGARLFLQYGLTEVIRSTFLPPDEVDRRPGSMGTAVPGARVEVVRPDLTPCAPGEAGELVHRGPTVALGYWNDPEATARVFRACPTHGRAVFSGDVVRRDEDGFLHFVGRTDRMIKTMGYRVGPDEVADVLFGSGAVAEAVVTAEPDPARGERIVAHVVLRPGAAVERLEAFCRAEMPRYMQPARIQVHDALPRGAAGKYDTGALRVPCAA